MMSLFLRAILVSFCAATAYPAFSQERLYAVGLKGNFTSSSRLFRNIEARDEFTRAQYVNLDDIFGFGIEVRRTIDDTRIHLALSVEYLSVREGGFLRTAVPIPVEEGYWALPVELTGYFTIPFSTERARLFIGGGGGAYFGERESSVATERAKVVDAQPGFGIHVVTRFEYSVTEWLGLSSELKFRDIQFESTQVYTKSSVEYSGYVVQLHQQPVRSRVNVDGMLIDVGLVARF